MGQRKRRRGSAQHRSERWWSVAVWLATVPRFRNRTLESSSRFPWEPPTTRGKEGRGESCVELYSRGADCITPRGGGVYTLPLGLIYTRRCPQNGGQNGAPLSLALSYLLSHTQSLLLFLTLSLSFPISLHLFLLILPFPLLHRLQEEDLLINHR